MPRASDLKKGGIVDIDGAPHMVEELTVSTPSARGAASLYRFRFRDVVTRRKRDYSCKGDEMFAEATIERRPAQFLYREADRCIFLDLEDYSQFGFDPEEIAEQAPFLVEDLEEITAVCCDGRVLTIELPPAVTVKIVNCDPSIRGASATARTKSATLATGLVVQVPEYIENGETIRVDTRTGSFLSRA